MKRTASILTIAIVLAASTAPLIAQEKVKEGRDLFDRLCIACHAADGAPREPVAKLLKVEMRHLGAAEVQAKTDDVLRKEILQGTGKMKPVKLTEAEAANVIFYVRSLKERR